MARIGSLILLGFTGILCLAGCGGVDLFEEDSTPVTITGKVLYRGHPLNGGWLVFSSDPQFGAGTDLIMTEVLSEGTFHVRDHQHQGLKPGYYRMSVTSHPNPHWQLPRRYHDPNTSGLRCTVSAQQPLRLRIELD